MSGFIEAAGVRRALDLSRADWTPGKPLKLLLVGYLGSQNTGSNARTEEMVRQFRHVLGEDQVELSVATLNKALTTGYFLGARQVAMPLAFP